MYIYTCISTTICMYVHYARLNTIHKLKNEIRAVCRQSPPPPFVATTQATRQLVVCLCKCCETKMRIKCVNIVNIVSAFVPSQYCAYS